MTELTSTRGTSEMHWEPDTALIDAAREIAPIIREHSQEAERERRLSQPVLGALRETGLLRMTTPRSLGGLETDPVTRALVGEEVGRHDSAAAWTLENPLDWAFFCCRLPDEGAEEIYRRGADILIAAQFGRPLKATSTNGGYHISGRAPFVSNCYDADWISSTVLVDEDESAEDEPEMRMVYFPSEECEIIDTWDVMGMRGTGETHSLEQKADLLLAMAHAMSSAVQAVELACSIAGTTAFRATSPLERCFRDVQTMRHHVFASEQR